MTESKFSELLGKTLISISGGVGDTKIDFITTDGTKYSMYHESECCESVLVEDIDGDISQLIGNPILQAEETTSNENPRGVVKEYQESFTWTFYKLGTVRGYVTIRWYGESNGYYSESVSFYKSK